MSEGTKRAQKKQKTREKLVLAAFGLFRARGISATKTSEIAQMAGVSHGAVFVHFPSRDELVAEVIGMFAKRVIDGLGESLEREGSGLRDVLRAHLIGLAEHEAFYARLVTEGPLLPSYARSSLLGIQSAISLQIGEAAEREVAEGTIREVSLPLLFNTWIGLVHHYVVNRDLFAPGERVLEARRDELVDHFMGLLSPSPTPERKKKTR